MLLAISSPADNERGAIYAEQVLAALHQANRNRLPLSLIFGRHDQTVGLYCRVRVDSDDATVDDLSGEL